MPIISFFHLQVHPVLQTDFVLKAGLLVIILCGVIIYLTILYRVKKNMMYAERKLQEQGFNEELLKSRVEVQELTFTSLGTELHDNVGQLISTALMMINMAERELKVAPPILISAAETLNQGILEIRSLSRSLQKDWLEQFDLEQNLEAEVLRLNKTGIIDVKVDICDADLLLTPQQQFLFFRIIQEGIQNVIKHSGASLLVIQISVKKNPIRGSSVEARLTDNGRGFKINDVTNGLGMANMRQRAHNLSAAINWISGNAGTVVVINLPIKSTHEI